MGEEKTERQHRFNLNFPSDLWQKVNQYSKQHCVSKRMFVTHAVTYLIEHINLVRNGYEARYVKKDDPKDTVRIMTPYDI